MHCGSLVVANQVRTTCFGRFAGTGLVWTGHPIPEHKKHWPAILGMYYCRVVLVSYQKVGVSCLCPHCAPGKRTMPELRSAGVFPGHAVPVVKGDDLGETGSHYTAKD